MSDVFVSYASEDRTRVEPIVEQLQAAGWSVWWDRDIAAGAGFEQTIDEEIQATRCVVVAWSERSVSSRWVRNEALEGLERDILIPLMLENVRVPVAFRQSQSIDFSGSLQFDHAMQALLGATFLATSSRFFILGSSVMISLVCPPSAGSSSVFLAAPFFAVDSAAAAATPISFLKVRARSIRKMKVSKSNGFWT